MPRDLARRKVHLMATVDLALLLMSDPALRVQVREDPTTASAALDVVPEAIREAARQLDGCGTPICDEVRACLFLLLTVAGDPGTPTGLGTS
jgi:hypothetical protein